MTYSAAVEYVGDLETGGYTDWRLPIIQESFSLANQDGKLDVVDTSNPIPYIDSDYFDFYYNEEKSYTDSSTTSEKNYGFNWANGHLNSYADGSSSGFSIPTGVRAVRGEEDVFCANEYIDNDDDTITVNATKLMWS